jgi:hypothetical protein
MMLGHSDRKSVTGCEECAYAVEYVSCVSEDKLRNVATVSVSITYEVAIRILNDERTVAPGAEDVVKLSSVTDSVIRLCMEKLVDEMVGIEGGGIACVGDAI